MTFHFTPTPTPGTLTVVDLLIVMVLFALGAFWVFYRLYLLR